MIRFLPKLNISTTLKPKPKWETLVINKSLVTGLGKTYEWKPKPYKILFMFTILERAKLNKFKKNGAIYLNISFMF